MSVKAADNRKLFVDDVVTALTGTVEPRANACAVLKDQMRRAADDFDQRTAEAFARALIDSLCQEQLDPRRLEALLILGLAHPTILAKHRISLRAEGRRLAAILENSGQTDRAKSLLQTIEEHSATAEEQPNTKALVPEAVNPAAGRVERPEEAIERLLRKAEEAGSRGRTQEAIRALQEVVALDRNRRDVARMIRDLRWQDKDRKAATVRRLKVAALVLVLGLAVAGLVARENQVRARFRAIPVAAANDLEALRARLTQIDALVQQERAWVGMFEALREQSRLEREISDLDERAAQAKHEAELERARRLEVAEESRSRGMLLAQQGRYDDAIADLRQALDVAGPTWDRRTEVEANVGAIQDWIKKQVHTTPEGKR